MCPDRGRGAAALRDPVLRLAELGGPSLRRTPAALVVALASVLLGAAACHRERTTAGALYAPTGSTDPLGDHLQRIKSRLEPKGYRLVGEPQRGDLVRNGLIAVPGNVEAGSCYAFVGLGGGGIRDLDLYLLDSSMRQLGRDSRRDAHPWIVHCPTAPNRIVARLRVYLGQGPYVFAIFQGPPGLGDLSDVVSAGLLSSPPPSVDGPAAERIAMSDADQSKQGGVRAGRPITLRMEQRQTRPIPIQLVAGACYTIASFGSQEVRDTDLFLRRPDGTEAGRDDRRARDAILRFCASQTATYQILVKANRGTGLVYLVAYGRDPTPVLAAAGDIAAPEGAEEEAPAGPSSPADEAFRSLDSDVRARGYEPVGEAIIGDVAAGSPLVFEMPLEADRCYAVAAATGSNGEIEVHLRTAGGDAIEAEVSAGAATIVRACADGSGPHRIEVGLRRGDGPVMGRAYRWPRSTRGPFGLEGVPFVRLAEATSLLALEGYEPTGAPESKELRQGASVSYSVAPEVPVCHALAAVGGLGIDELDLEVSAGGQPVATDTSDGPIAIVQVCPPFAQGLSAKVTARRGSGRVLYQEFQGPQGPPQ